MDGICPLPLPCSSCSRDPSGTSVICLEAQLPLSPTDDRDREECQKFAIGPLLRFSSFALMAERQDRNLGPTKFRSWGDCGEVLIMEGKLAPPPKFYSGPLFRNTCDLICPFAKLMKFHHMCRGYVETI